MVEILNTNIDLPLIDRLLFIRQIEDKEKFLHPTWQNSWYDPFMLNNMNIAIERIIKAIKSNERIVIFGDYDVDGITSTYILFYFFYKFLNYKNISIRLPSRADGYGIKSFHIDEIKEKGVTLIITVDNGITAIDEVKYAKQKGIDVIITDHHDSVSELPDAIAILNPKITLNYPFKELAGVGVAFKLITALSNKLSLSKPLKQKIIDYFLPVVAIGTIADCVPLLDENRFLVKKGLEIMNSPKRRPSNISNLIKFLNLKNIDSYHISFLIGPRLNASGRINKPDDSFQVLFQHNSFSQIKYLEKIEQSNKERQLIQAKILLEIEKKIDYNSNILLAIGDFHEGIIGIVAGKLSEKYNKPAIVLSINKNTKKIIGSCRSPIFFSVIDMLKNIGKKGILERYGGHRQAGGFVLQLDNLDKFRQEIKKIGDELVIDEKEREKIIFVDTVLEKKDLIGDDILKLDLLAPFGEGNLVPRFLINNLKIKKVDVVGKEKKHIKLLANKDGVDITLLKWNGLDLLDKINSSSKIDCIVEYSKDYFNNSFYFKILNIL